VVKGENYVKIKKMISWKTEKRKLNELRPWERNPRQATEKQWQDLERSLEKFSLADPLIINKDNTIIGGHFRWKVLKEKGIEEVDVRVPDEQLSEKEVEELNVRLNKNLGEWDYDLLANFDEDLLKGIGFGDEELDEIFGIETADEFDVEEELEKVLAGKERRCKEGDLWQLGEHRLYIGDATKKESWERVLGDEKVDMVFTDPPYGINLNTDFSSMKRIGQGKRYNKVIGDEKEFNPGFIFNFVSHCKEIFLWGADYYAEKIKDRNKGSWFVWDKTGNGISPNSAYEKQFGSNFELCWSKKKHKRQIIPILWKGIFGLSKEDTKKRVHPTQKPVELCKWFIEKFSKRGQIVMDCFGGSGSTLIACEIMKRKCRMIEIEPIYGEVILARWEKFTGKKAELLRDF